MNVLGANGMHLLMCGMMLMASGCNLSGGWKTERYRDDATGVDTFIAKQRFKQDSVEVSAAAKCSLPAKLAIELTMSENFKATNAGGVQQVHYKLGIDGQAPVAMTGTLAAPDTLVIDRKPSAAPGAAAIDLGRATRIFLQFDLASGPTNVVINPGEAGITDVFKACGIDPLMAAQQPTGSVEVHRPAVPLNGQPVVKKVDLKTLSAQWNCSGDMGDFTFTIDNYRYNFSDDSPWSALTGRVSVGAYQAGVDGNATFPITFEDGAWDAEDSPWSYAPVGQGGTIYYISTRTGQQAQCTRS